MPGPHLCVKAHPHCARLLYCMTLDYVIVLSSCGILKLNIHKESRQMFEFESFVTTSFEVHLSQQPKMYQVAVQVCVHVCVCVCVLCVCVLCVCMCCVRACVRCVCACMCVVLLHCLVGQSTATQDKASQACQGICPSCGRKAMNGATDLRLLALH